MALLDDFFVRSKQLKKEKKWKFYTISCLAYIVFIHAFMLPSYVAETGWDTLHSILLFIWFLIAALVTIGTTGAALIVVGGVFWIAEWFQLNVLVLLLPDWLFEGMWKRLTFTWSMGLLLLPIIVLIITLINRLAEEGGMEEVEH